ncbi:MAG: hypothetical protein JWL97_4240 [Gemmatimonadales bacterium]|nr:hypothetical protein [Gemmatimonadales bacterium]
MRTDWTELPEELRDVIEDRTGPIGDVVPAATGNHADIASTLHTPSGRTFVKAARKVSPEQDGPEVRSLRWEAAVSPYVPEYAPRLLWEVEAGGWLALGFEHVQARHADYSPGSPDLAVLGKVVEAFQSMPCPDVVTRPVERQWAHRADVAAPMSGTCMLHTDLNPANLLIPPDGRAYVIDWGFTRKGAAWVEPAVLMQWLIAGGHSPREAEEWAGRFPSWRSADPATLDLFAAANADRWETLAADNPPAWAVRLAEVTRQWATYRTR